MICLKCAKSVQPFRDENLVLLGKIKESCRCNTYDQLALNWIGQ